MTDELTIEQVEARGWVFQDDGQMARAFRHPYHVATLYRSAFGWRWTPDGTFMLDVPRIQTLDALIALENNSK